MERSLTHKWSRTELTELMLSRMSSILYKIIHVVIMIVAIFHMPLQHKFQMLSDMRKKEIGKKVI